MDGTSGFHRRHDEMSMLKLLWGRVTPFMYVRLEEDGPVVEEFRRLLWPAAGHAFRHGTSLATTAQFLGWLTLAPLSVCDAVVFYFCALLACVFCVMVFVSARYVKLFPLLIRCGSAPAFYFKRTVLKKNPNPVVPPPPPCPSVLPLPLPDAFSDPVPSYHRW
jgi:hypothetical protein